jgi:phage terminase large subunit-like protein
MAIKAVEAFLDGRRVLYAAPTNDQVGTFWRHVTNALHQPIDAKIFYKNETEHIIELRGTGQRLRAKTAFNAETLRGDYADLLILDEWQLMNEDAWGVVGAPMLLDNDGDAVFIYTPPSVRTAGMSKAQDKRHAAKLFKMAQADTTGRWAAFTFSSHDNPHLSQDALRDITGDMSNLAYRQEIMAEDIDEVPGALWLRTNLDQYRVALHPGLYRIVVAIDPAISANEASNETGIVVAGIDEKGHAYVLDDLSQRASPDAWARAAVTAYHDWQADLIVAESNQGGDMVANTLFTVDPNVPVELVRATRGKYTRAEPVAALYEQGKVHHVGSFAELEDQLCGWLPGNTSPDRLDALVWALTLLLIVPPAVDGYLIYDEGVSISPF